MQGDEPAVGEQDGVGASHARQAIPHRRRVGRIPELAEELGDRIGMLLPGLAHRHASTMSTV
jgi:hypothetical protein